MAREEQVRRSGVGFILLASLLCAAGPASAQRLKTFADALKKGSPVKNAGRVLDSDLSGEGGCGSALLDLFCQTVGLGVSISNEYGRRRRPGDAALPVLRLDGGYQRMVGRIDAFSWRAELGWRWLGAAYERMEMREHVPVERLSSDTAEVLLRTFGMEGFRLDWAAGYRGYAHDGRHDGVQTGVSLGAYLSALVGLEADLRWGSVADATISDYRVRWSLRPRGASGLALSGGYRVLRAGDATLHGPEGGAAWVW